MVEVERVVGEVGRTVKGPPPRVPVVVLVLVVGRVVVEDVVVHVGRAVVGVAVVERTPKGPRPPRLVRGVPQSLLGAPGRSTLRRVR